MKSLFHYNNLLIPALSGLYIMLLHLLIHMRSSETNSKKEQDINNDDEVLPQIGEDPGLPADTIEQDLKKMDQKENKERKGTNSIKTQD
jgi:hypothetical protein